MRCIDWFYQEIINRGVVRSLYRFTEDQGISYWHCWRCLKQLERRGLVSVKRQPGRPLVITKSDGDR